MFKISVIIAVSVFIQTSINLNNLYKDKNFNIWITPNVQEPSVINRRLIGKPFRDFYRALWWSNSLKQWKRRRRMANLTLSVVHCSEEDESIANVVEMGLQQPDEHVTSTPLKSVNPKLAALISEFKSQWPVRRWRRYGFFTDDYILLINAHWLRFPPPNPSVDYTLGALYVVMMFIGCSGNGLVIYLYLRCSTLRTPGNILVANLALSDFLMLAKTPVFIFNSFNLGPALGKYGCLVYGFLGGLTGVTSIATLAAIALDRYWAVVRPLEPLRALTAVRARLFAIGSWLYAIIFAIIPALDIGYGRYVPEGFLTSCSFDYLTNELPPRYFIFVFFCAAWIAPFCTIFFCYLNIFRVVVCQRNVAMKNQDQKLSSRHVKQQVKRKAEIKLAGLVIIVIGLFFVSWTPYAIVALLGIFGKKELITPLVSMVPALFCKTAACVNPFVYIITHPIFRKEFQKLISSRKSRHMNSTMKSTRYSTNASKIHRPSKDLSDTEVEVVEMKDIPYQSDTIAKKQEERVQTISSKVSEREGSQRSMSMKSIEENVLPPPSWYAKPKFAKKKSFHRRSTKSTISINADQIV